MIENLSSKSDSLSDKTPPTANTKVVESDLTESGPSSQREDIYELPQSLGQHIVMTQTSHRVDQYILTFSRRFKTFGEFILLPKISRPFYKTRRLRRASDWVRDTVWMFYLIKIK